MELEQQISTLAEGKLTDARHFIVDVVVSARKGPKKILIIIDGDNGVSIDDCANVSRELSKTFDELALFEDSYLLEVSTPGVDYPLKLKRQYHKHIGRKLRVKLEGKTIEGKLEAVGDDAITLLEETGSGKKKETISTAINFSQIEKAFVLVSFK
jgi:ribosome maturation factor RimP